MGITEIRCAFYPPSLSDPPSLFHVPITTLARRLLAKPRHWDSCGLDRALLSVGYPAASCGTPTWLHPRMPPDTSSRIPQLERALAESILNALYLRRPLTEPQRQRLQCYSTQGRWPPSLPAPEAPALSSLGSRQLCALPLPLGPVSLSPVGTGLWLLYLFFAHLLFWICQLLSFSLPVLPSEHSIFSIFIRWSHTAVTSALFPASQLSPGLPIKLPQPDSMVAAREWCSVACTAGMGVKATMAALPLHISSYNFEYLYGTLLWGGRCCYSFNAHQTKGQTFWK